MTMLFIIFVIALIMSNYAFYEMGIVSGRKFIIKELEVQTKKEEQKSKNTFYMPDTYSLHSH